MQSVGKDTDLPPPPPRSLVSPFLHSLELCHVRRLFSQGKKKHKNSDGDQAVCGSFYNTGDFPLLGFLLRFKNGIVQLSFAEPELLIFRHLLSFIPPTLPMQTRLWAFWRVALLCASPPRSFYRGSCPLAFILPSLYPAYECMCSICHELYVTPEKKKRHWWKLNKQTFLAIGLFFLSLSPLVFQTSRARWILSLVRLIYCTYSFLERPRWKHLEMERPIQTTLIGELAVCLTACWAQ